MRQCRLHRGPKTSCHPAITETTISDPLPKGVVAALRHAFLSGYAAGAGRSTDHDALAAWADYAPDPLIEAQAATETIASVNAARRRAEDRIRTLPPGASLLDAVPDADWDTPDPDGRIEAGAATPAPARAAAPDT